MADFTNFLGLYLPNRNDALDLDTTLADNFLKLDQKLQEISSTTTQIGENSFYYNSDGSIATIQTPGSLFTFFYDDEGVVSSIREDQGTQTITTNFIYDENGALSSVSQEVTE